MNTGSRTLAGAVSTASVALSPHQRMSALYLLLASGLAVLALGRGGLAWLLLYPAGACAGIGFAYAFNHADLKVNSNALYSRITAVVLAPYRVAALASWRWYCRGIEPWHALTPGILIGRRLRRHEARKLLQRGVTAVLDLAPELSEAPGLKRLDYRHVPMLDLVPPSFTQLEQALAFIESRPPGGCLFIHCALGCSRSALVLAAYLVKCGQTPETALARIGGVRPGIVVPEYNRRVLRQFEQRCRQPANRRRRRGAR